MEREPDSDRGEAPWTRLGRDAGLEAPSAAEALAGWAWLPGPDRAPGPGDPDTGDLERGSTLTRTEILALQAADLGYATPKVDVRGACFRDGRILLVQETADPGRWTLPGGWADVNETPSEAVAREIAEESGFTVAVRKLVGVFDRERRGCLPPYPTHVYKLLFLCDITGGRARPSLETEGSAFFAEEGLPELSLARINPDLVRVCFRHHRHPDRPGEFD